MQKLHKDVEIRQRRRAMLTVCLHKLCVKDSLANAVRKVEKCVNIVPGGVENRPREGPKWPLGGLRRALGRQVGPIWLSRPLESGIWAALGCAWDAPGGSWAALGTSRGAPGASWGAPGASWDAPGVHFGLPGVTFWSLLDLFLVSPCEIAKTSKFVDSMALFEVFPGPEGSKIVRKSTPGASEAALGGPAGVHGAQVEVHGVQVGLHRAQVALHRLF